MITVPDERWKRCWIKSIALLPNILAKNYAVDQGADEAVFVDDGDIITECSATNIFAVLNGQLVTHPVGPKVLPGITRAILLQLATDLGIDTQERPWTVAEAASASELFITSTTREADWIWQWNGRQIVDRCGPVVLALLEALRREINPPACHRVDSEVARV